MSDFTLGRAVLYQNVLFDISGRPYSIFRCPILGCLNETGKLKIAAGHPNPK